MRSKLRFSGRRMKAEAFRQPLAVAEIRLWHNGDTFPVCPRCHVTMEREYQGYCDRCGQCLNWDTFCDASIILTC